VASDADLFAVLGLPRRLSIDPGDLERCYHAASRAVHPDRHQTASLRERELSLAASAAVNRAYRTLRDPFALGRYWLELHGTPLGADNNRIPPALAAEVFAVQEELDGLRAGGAGRAEVVARRGELAARLDGLVGGLATLWSTASPPLAELKTRLSEIAYLRTLLADVEQALGEETSGSHHRH
jgi:molecular chaperone HscB